MKTFSCKLILSSLFVSSIFMGKPVLAANNVQIKSIDEITDFTNQKVVYINKGDNPEYKDVNFDDSSWQLISLPSVWESVFPDWTGICWYRIHINFPDNVPLKSYGINLGEIIDADETYFNGVMIGKSGTVDSEKESAYDKIRVYEIPSSLIKPGQDNIIAIKIRGMFQGQNGPYKGSILLGYYDILHSNLLLLDFFDLSFIIIYLVVSVYFILFFFRRRVDIDNLMFSIFTISISIYFFFRTQFKFFLDMDFHTAKKIEYMVLSLIIMLSMEFMMFYFKFKHRLIHYIYIGLSFIFFFIMLFTNKFVFWDWINITFMQPTWLVGLGIIIYILVRKFRVDIDARFMIGTILLLVLTLVNDILVSRTVYNFIRLSNYGFLAFIGSIALILDNRFVRLHNEVSDLNLNLEKKVEKRTEELNNALEETNAAKTETDNILKNVSEGIFLLNNEFRIGDNYSNALSLIFERTDLGNIHIIELLKDSIPDDILKSLQDYLDLTLAGNINEKRLKRLNPVSDINISIRKDDTLLEKYVSFGFTKIKASGKDYILTTVRDITEEKKLGKQIEENSEKARIEMELLFGIIHIKPQVMKIFINETNKEIKIIEQQLESARFSGELKKLLESVYRSVHAIKGDSGHLGLEIFAQQAHKLEDTIKDLLEKKELLSIDLLSLLYPLVDLKEILKKVEELLTKISAFQDIFGDEELSTRDMLVKSFAETVRRTAERLNKKAIINADEFFINDSLDIDQSFLKKIIIQIVKNSVTHGIEIPSVRLQQGKPEQGNILLKSAVTDNLYKIIIHDDGSGISLDRLRQKAILSGKYTEEKINSWTNDQLVRLIYESGISTQDNVTIDSGRGVGLNIVKYELKKIGGKIHIRFSPGKFTEFIVEIPISKQFKG